MTVNFYPYKTQYVVNKKDAAIKKKVATIAKKRKVNNKVRKLIKPGPQKNALVAISRQIKLLQLQRFGSIQRQEQFITIIANDPVLGPNPFPCTVVTPWCMCFNQFHCDPSAVSTPLFQGSVSGVAPKIPLLNTINTFKKKDFDIDLDEEFDWNSQRNNQTTVSLIEYLPVYAKVTINISGQLLAVDSIVKYRFDLFKLKSMPTKSSQHSWSMPQQCGAYYRMHDDTALTKNKFSSSYHEIIMTKYLTIVPSSQYVSIQKINYNIEIPYSFGKTNEGLKCNISTLPLLQNVYSNIPQEDQMWLLISTNSVTPPTFDFTITRSLVWRDKHQNDGPAP